MIYFPLKPFQPKLLSTSKDRLPVLPSVMDEKPLLPEITPHYKPLPRVPVREEPPESSLSRMTEEEALNFVFQSKYNRYAEGAEGRYNRREKKEINIAPP